MDGGARPRHWPPGTSLPGPAGREGAARCAEGTGGGEGTRGRGARRAFRGRSGTGDTRARRGHPREGGRKGAPRSGAQRPGARGGGGKRRRVCAWLRGNLEIRAWRAFGVVVWFGVSGGQGDASVRSRCRLRGAARPPVVRVGPGAERWPWGRRPAPRSFGGKRLLRPAFAWFGLIFNTCPFIYNSGCSDSSPVSAPIYACTPFSFLFPKGQPRHSPREGESCSAVLGFACLNIELEKIPPLCGLINNKSDRFAFPINDTGKLSS